MGNVDSRKIELLDACYSGNLVKVQHLVEVDKVEFEGATDLKGRRPLVGAISSGIADLVEYVLKNDVDVNLGEDGMHGTPLFMACQERTVDLVLMLLSTGKVDVNKGSRDGKSPLWIACSKGCIETVRLLIVQGKADILRAASDGSTPLHAAAEIGNIDIADQLLKRKERNQLVRALNKAGQSAVHVACQNGHLECAQYLVAQGLDIDGVDSYGLTPFGYACKYGHAKVVEWLLAKDQVDTLASSWSFTTPIYLAAANCHTEVLELLLNSKKDSGASSYNIYLNSPAEIFSTMYYWKNGVYPNGPFPMEGRTPGPPDNLTQVLARFQTQTAPQKQSSTDWEEQASSQSDAFNRKNVKFLPKAKFFETSTFKSFSECEQLHWHIPGTSVQAGKILFVCFRWLSPADSASNSYHFQTLRKYLQKNTDVEYVWLDYSCIPPDPRSIDGLSDQQKTDFWFHQINLPTALFMCTYMLICPEIKEVVIERKMEKDSIVDVTIPVSYVKDTFEQAWAIMKVFTAILGEKKVVCAFKFGNHLYFHDFPEKLCSDLGFETACRKAIANLEKHNPQHFEKVNPEEIREYWTCLEPARAMQLLMTIAGDNNQAQRAVVFKCYSVSASRDPTKVLESTISHSEIQARYEFKELYEVLGEGSNEEDKLLAFNTLLQVAIFAVARFESKMTALEEYEAARNKAAANVQKSFRGYKTRKEVDLPNRSAEFTPVTTHRGHFGHQDVKVEEVKAEKEPAQIEETEVLLPEVQEVEASQKIAVGLQKSYRGSRDRKLVASMKESLENGAAQLQRVFQGNKEAGNEPLLPTESQKLDTESKEEPSQQGGNSRNEQVSKQESRKEQLVALPPQPLVDKKAESSRVASPKQPTTPTRVVNDQGVRFQNSGEARQNSIRNLLPSQESCCSPS